MLKKGSPLLLYLYYSFENKPTWFKFIWKVSDLFRKLISQFPKPLKLFVCDLIAYSVYYPLTKIAIIAPIIPTKIETTEVIELHPAVIATKPARGPKIT